MNQLVKTDQLPERLEIIKEKFSLSNRQLAWHGQSNGTTIGNILSGTIRKPSYEVLNNIATSLGISIKWLATGEGHIDNIDTTEAATPSKSADSGAFGQEVLDRVIRELKEQYEARISEMKETIGDLREQLKFNRDLIENFKEGHLGKSEGTIIKGLLAEIVEAEFEKKLAA